MANTWVKSNKYPGVRFRLHPTRKIGTNPDKYLTIFYKLDGKMIQESLGWTSKKWTELGPEGQEVKCGWTEKRAAGLLAELQENQRLGTGPRTLKEKREQADRKRVEEENARQEAEAAQAEEAARNIPLEVVWERYVNSCHGSKGANSIRTEGLFYRNWITPVIKKSMPIRNVSPAHLEKIKTEMIKSGKAPRSIQYCLALIRQVFNYATIHGLFHGDNPLIKSRIKAPKFDNRRLRYLTKQEADTLLSKLATKSPDLHDMALLSLHTGMRAGEIFALTWGDVDLGRGLLTLRNTKNGETRKAYLTRQAGMMLASRRPVSSAPTGLVFPGKGGDKIQAVSKSFERVVDELGLNNGIEDKRDHVVFHTLRHSFASLLVENGTALFTVKELLGHKDIRMTARYAHLGPSAMQEAAKQLGGLLENGDADRMLSSKTESMSQQHVEP